MLPSTYDSWLAGQVPKLLRHTVRRPKPAGSGGAQLSKIASALAESPRFLILDFRQVVRCCSTFALIVVIVSGDSVFAA